MSGNPYPLTVVFASYGNDSIATIQRAYEACEPSVFVLYTPTGWAAPWWNERVEKGEAWVRSLGFTPVQTASEGMAALVQRKKGWPPQGIQFCTKELKIDPALAWLAEADPLGIAQCLVGVRHEESRERQSFPARQVSPNHGKRVLRAPLAALSSAERDELINRTPFAPRAHRSDECFPCINSNKADIRRLAEHPEIVDGIERLETAMGVTSKGKPRTMFRPYRHMGATGIREIVRWAQSDRGKFELDDGTGGGGCDSGYCGL